MVDLSLIDSCDKMRTKWWMHSETSHPAGDEIMYLRVQLGMNYRKVWPRSTEAYIRIMNSICGAWGIFANLARWATCLANCVWINSPQFSYASNSINSSYTALTFISEYRNVIHNRMPIAIVPLMDMPNPCWPQRLHVPKNVQDVCEEIRLGLTASCVLRCFDLIQPNLPTWYCQF